MEILSINILPLIELINWLLIGFRISFQICYTSASVVDFWLEVKFRNTRCVNGFFLYLLLLLESLAIPHKSFRDGVFRYLFGITGRFILVVLVINNVTIIIFIGGHVVFNPWSCSIRNDSWWHLHLLQVDVFSLLYDQLFCRYDRLVVVSRRVFFDEHIKLFWILQLLLMVLGVVVFGHEDWFERAVVKQFFILVLLPCNLNVLFFVLIHFYTSLIKPGTWILNS